MWKRASNISGFFHHIFCVNGYTLWRFSQGLLLFILPFTNQPKCVITVSYFINLRALPMGIWTMGPRIHYLLLCTAFWKHYFYAFVYGTIYYIHLVDLMKIRDFQAQPSDVNDPCCMAELHCHCEWQMVSLSSHYVAFFISNTGSHLLLRFAKKSKQHGHNEILMTNTS